MTFYDHDDLAGFSPVKEVLSAELDAIADEREAEMECDPTTIVSHEEMLRFIASKKR